jgi:hypothetical protein
MWTYFILGKFQKSFREVSARFGSLNKNVAAGEVVNGLPYGCNDSLGQLGTWTLVIHCLHASYAALRCTAVAQQ